MGSFILHLSTHAPNLPGDHARGWVVSGPCRARIVNDGYGPRASIVHSPLGLAVGLVRLDNRAHVRRLAQCDSDQSDLAMMVAAVSRIGERCIREFEGDFAFVYWDAARRVVVAARDAMGVRSLYRADDSTSRSFASRAGLLAAERPRSLEYVADCIAHGISVTRTPYEGVTRFPRATYAVIRDGRSTECRYWSPFQFETNWSMPRQTALEEFTELFKGAMRVHLDGNAGCWADLSGGLDSSSVVSMASWLANVEKSVPPLGGTLTYVETLGLGDERVYSDAVVRDWSLRNEQFVDYRLWQDADSYPPIIDEPDGAYAMFARDEVTCRTVCSTGSRILLTGVGPDHYLHGNYSYFADWIARGRIRDAAREIYLEAVRNRVSFWKLARETGIAPFFRREETPKPEQWPAWVNADFARQYPVESRATNDVPKRGTAGRYFVTQAAGNVDNVEYVISRGLIGETLDVRYPLLQRALVEFCLQLPPELKVTDGMHKWVLREAMRGILPEKVRQRTSKGFINGGIERTYVDRHARLDALLQQSILGEMGCIDVDLARKALAERTNAGHTDSTRLHYVLDLETWLSVVSGRWTATGSPRVAIP
jgi:asparagine synthase (glutamine-hydrolysing)